GFAGVGGDRLIALFRQGDAQGLADRRLVVDDEHAKAVAGGRRCLGLRLRACHTRSGSVSGSENDFPRHDFRLLRLTCSASRVTSASASTSFRTCSVVRPVSSRICCESCQGEWLAVLAATSL